MVPKHKSIIRIIRHLNQLDFKVPNMVNISLSFSAFNEEENLPKLIGNAIKICEEIADKYEILIVVYEGSVDRSIEMVKKYQSENKKIRLILQKKPEDTRRAK